jgi:hypothetical protein
MTMTKQHISMSNLWLLGPLAALVLEIALGQSSLLAQETPTPPERMTYQGFLVDGSGLALGLDQPKNYDVEFRIWNQDQGGQALWGEQQTVAVDKGYFSVLLGEGAEIGVPRPSLSSLFAGPDASERYVGITVKGIGSGGTDVNITPRLRLLSTPYTFLARNATAVVSPDGTELVSSANGSLTIHGEVNATRVTGLMDAGKLDQGMLPYDRLGSDVARRSGGNNFNGNQSVNGTVSANSFSGSGTIPVGGIIMWSGAVNQIPSGWRLCDGAGGTPNLLGRFIVGAGAGGGYNPGNIGGTDSVRIAANNLPALTLDVSVPVRGIGGISFPTSSNTAVRHPSNAGGNTGGNLSGTASLSSANTPMENRPRYYALAFIMRVQ